MAVIAATDMQGPGERDIVWTTAGASDTFAFNKSKNPVLLINNGTAGAITPNIDGDGASAAYVVPGVGVVDLTAGYDVSEIAIGDIPAIPLVSIRGYLVGEITLTGADGAEIAILEF